MTLQINAIFTFHCLCDIIGTTSDWFFFNSLLERFNFQNLSIFIIDIYYSILEYIMSTVNTSGLIARTGATYQVTSLLFKCINFLLPFDGRQ